MEDQRRWFVLRDRDICEVQLLDRFGRAAAYTQFTPGAAAVVVDGKCVPNPVLQVAERCSPGHGQFVDSSGRLFDWMSGPDAGG
jgi:hypothetical protein